MSISTPIPLAVAGKLIAGKYRIIQETGRGGMGVVYKAEDLKLKRPVALKFLPPGLTDNAELKERFIVEAQAAAALSHPNICTIFEVEEAEGRSYIAMEFVEGETLREKIKRGPLKIEDALDVAVQVAAGLDEAHKKGIIHRDIKSANIMVTDKGQAKVMDFGLAKLRGGSSLTKSRTTLGTVAYMSPEQARGDKVDQRTDIWSLGVVLYEMIAGQLPFRGDHDQAVIHSILKEKPEPLNKIRPVAPTGLEQIIDRALAKDPRNRYQTTAELLKELKQFHQSMVVPETAGFNLKRFLLRPRIVVPAVLLLCAVIIAAVFYSRHQTRVQWAKHELLPKIKQIYESGLENCVAAYKLAEVAEKYIPHDPELSRLFSQIAITISIRTEPPSAKIYINEYNAPDSEWQYQGISPAEKIRLPLGIFQWKLEKEGYETILAATSSWAWIEYMGDRRVIIPNNLMRVMDKKGSIPLGMVRVTGAKTDAGRLDDFFIDKYEVTNRQYKEFIDSGGYRKKEYWKHEFIKKDKVLTWEEAVKGFVDQSGFPGPAAWQAGDYPKGQENCPVSGVSWYEAAAYAEFAGKSLPTVLHWGLAFGENQPIFESNRFLSKLAKASNFRDEGIVPVGSYAGLTSYGAYDMAGNVREWCWNQAPQGRTIRGGAWNDAAYMSIDLSQASPYDRSPKNGLRCVLYLNPDKVLQSVFETAKVIKYPDYYKEQPVADSVFQVYREQFSYDKTDLKAQIEKRNENSQEWVQEKITFNAAYDNERMIAYLFLPRESLPPYQTVIYFPGTTATELRSSKDLDQYYEFSRNLLFMVKSGRAVLFPVYKGTFERGIDANSAFFLGENSHLYTEYVIKLVKDFKRCIDYLETRPDIDCQKLAYFGFSWGGRIGSIITAVEDRLKASVLMVGGMRPFGRPEINQINYVAHVKIPTLMLNGKYDMFFPYKIATKPMFDLIGTPEENKELKLYDTDHFVPRNELIKETLAWLDKYLGPVKR